MDTTYGLISVIPILVVIVLAMATKNATLSLLAGAIMGCIIFVRGSLTGTYTVFMETLYQVLMNSDTIWIILVIVLFGALISLLRKTGGVLGFASLADKFVKTREQSMIATWVLGIIIFIDDYLNNLAVGTVMQNITDKFKVSREMLTFIITSTGATVCAVLPISSWGIFMMAQMDSSGMQPGTSPMALFVKTMPYIVYGWIAVFVVPLFIYRVIPIFGQMKKVEMAVLNHTDVTSVPADGKQEAMDGEDVPENKRRALNFILPLIVLTGIIIYSGDMQIGVIAALIFTIIMVLVQRIKTFKESFDIIIEGMTEMFSMIILLVVSYVLLEVNTKLGLTNYVINSTIDYINPNIFAVSTFIIVSLLAFGTGTFWGLAIIAFPVMIPYALAVGANVFLVAGAIISGCTVGAHICFYGDTVILASTVTKVNPVDYFKCAAPLCSISIVLSIVFYTVAGFIL